MIRRPGQAGEPAPATDADAARIDTDLPFLGSTVDRDGIAPADFHAEETEPARHKVRFKRSPQKQPGRAKALSADLIREQLRKHDRTVRQREARRREKEMLETAFRTRNVATLKEGQDALNIAFGAVLSAYVGNVLAALGDKSFSPTELAYFFVMIGLFITGLCIGNSVLLRGYRWLAVLFLGVSFLSAYLALGAARALGFEIPILKVMVICWVAALLAGDLVLSAIIYVHHHRSVK